MSKEVKEFRDKCSAFIRNVNFQYNQHLILKNISNNKNYLETNHRLSNSIWIGSDFICEEFNDLIDIINNNPSILDSLIIEFSSMCDKLVRIFQEIDDNVLTEKILRKFKILRIKDKLNNLTKKCIQKRFLKLTGVAKLSIYLYGKIKENEK